MGALHALAAAVCNATIGVLCRWGFATRMDHLSLAFYRAAAGFLAVTLMLFVTRRISAVLALKRRAPGLALAAFFGVFVLYTGETWALSLAPVATVSFLLYGSGVFAVLLGALWLKERMTVTKSLSVLVVLAGIYMMFAATLEAGGFAGAALAVTAGAGYSLFLLLLKRIDAPGGLATLWWLLGFGTLCLAVPLAFRGIQVPRPEQLPAVFALALIPTLGGFFFTTMAIAAIEASRVQIYEMSEPAFAALLAFAVLGEKPAPASMAGAAVILLGVALLRFGDTLLLRRTVRRRYVTGASPDLPPEPAD